MQLQRKTMSSVDDVAKVFYINQLMVKTWNAQRNRGELRLLTGWAWTSRDGKFQRQGFKTISVCYRDAWYELIQGGAVPIYRSGSHRGYKATINGHPATVRHREGVAA